VLEAMPDGIALLDANATIGHVNELFCALTGYSREELTGQNVQLLVPDRLRNLESIARAEFERDLNARMNWSDLNLSIVRKGGAELPIDFALSTLSTDSEWWAVASIRDNSEKQRIEQARLEAEQHFRLAFEDSMAPMIFADLHNHIIDANDAFCEMVGRSRDELIGAGSEPFTHPDDVGIAEQVHQLFVEGELNSHSYIKRFLHRDGRTVVAEVSKSPAVDESGTTLYFIVSARDITAEQSLAAQLSYQALHDPLTGLANRVLFEDRLTQARARVLRQRDLAAVILIDLDDFKGVNDTHGHVVGDLLLTEVAHRLSAVSRDSDTLCRFGGDEFLYLAEGISSTEEAERVAARLLETLEEPIVLGEIVRTQHASLGVVVWGEASAHDTDVVRDADVALYEAKRLGKGRFVLYAPGMQQTVANSSSLVQQLRQALPDQELSVHYQPIVDLATTAVVGFEALMRWRHSERGWVSPNVFIPLAEQSDLILELGAFALHEAVLAASQWVPSAPGEAAPFVTVNLSARQFHDTNLVSLVERELDQSGLDSHRLVIEITEEVALLEVSGTLNLLDRLRRLGVGFAFDDFGTGFTSLSYLAHLDPMIIKIDPSFVRPSELNANSDRLLETIVTMGRNLEITMLAEGVETRSQLERLRQLKCNLGQGFLFSPAVPAEEVAPLIGARLLTEHEVTSADAPPRRIPGSPPT
jgi:diguanylate cyclase (GGDEF)-like protein/PAS domain S-box-containing protein